MSVLFGLYPCFRNFYCGQNKRIMCSQSSLYSKIFFGCLLYSSQLVKQNMGMIFWLKIMIFKICENFSLGLLECIIRALKRNRRRRTPTTASYVFAKVCMWSSGVTCLLKLFVTRNEKKILQQPSCKEVLVRWCKTIWSFLPQLGTSLVAQVKFR